MMSSKDLFAILDDKDKKLTLEEIKNIVSTIKEEVEFEHINGYGAKCVNYHTTYEYGFHHGEINICAIVLELLKHLKENNL